ncbi:protein SPEAR1-like isoform X1 [Typha latifolia]|uniref:protein SPEAR1-like isoform X1 n=1 Tax=Typha latifolia TaxID=4733 RepID=UPI003C2E56B5
MSSSSNFVDGSSESSRRGKKAYLEKPKQPRRGLGVAKLEKIRLHNQMMAGYFYPSFSSSFQSDINKEDIKVHLTSQSSPTSSSINAGSSRLFGDHPHMIRFQETATADIRYSGVLYSSATFRSFTNDSDEMMLVDNFLGPSVTLSLIPQATQDSVQNKQWDDIYSSTGAITQTSNSSDSQELDLELKL